MMIVIAFMMLFASALFPVLGISYMFDLEGWQTVFLLLIGFVITLLSTTLSHISREH